MTVTASSTSLNLEKSKVFILDICWNSWDSKHSIQQISFVQCRKSDLWWQNVDNTHNDKPIVWWRRATSVLHYLILKFDGLESIYHFYKKRSKRLLSLFYRQFWERIKQQCWMGCKILAIFRRTDQFASKLIQTRQVSLLGSAPWNSS